MAKQVPDTAVGAGTIVLPEWAREAVSAGAAFLVSRGCTPHLLEAMLDHAVPILPGAASASEAIASMEHGVTERKFFPAASTGCPQALRALAGPLPEVNFCPTGGIDRATSADYLALPNVACVGGSSLTPTNLVAAQDWDAITALAADVIA